MYTLDFGFILIFALVVFIVSALISGFSYLFTIKKPDAEKIGVYECGFSPFSDTRHPFEVRFFLVGILFIIFDLEISFLFPWSVVLHNIDTFGYWTMIIFLVVLTFGLIYEWVKGGLEWE